MKTLASTAGPPSPFDAACPLPNTVVTMPDSMSILRIRWFELSHTYRSPRESNARCSGWWNPAVSAGPPSPW